MASPDRSKHDKEPGPTLWRHLPRSDCHNWLPEQFVKWLLVACVLVTACIAFVWSNSPYDIDDALITYRYAENIAAGAGFVYNPGERILGTTTPLYTLILAGLRCLGISIPFAGDAISFAASIALVAVTMALVQQLAGSFWTALLTGVILLAQGSFLRYSMAGMETPWYTLLTMCSLFAFAEERTLLSAALAALAALTRLDGLVIVGTILLSCLIERRRRPIWEMAIVLLILAPWALIAFIYFGSPVPLSMLAKQGHLQARQGGRFWIWDRLFIRPLNRHMYLLPCTVVGMIQSFRERSRSSKWLALTLWTGTYLAAYTLVGIDFYEWYLVPVYPALACFAATGLMRLLRLACRRWAPPCAGTSRSSVAHCPDVALRATRVSPRGSTETLPDVRRRHSRDGWCLAS